MTVTKDAASAAKNTARHADILHRLAGVMARTGRSRAWIYKAINRGAFPEPVRLGGRAVAWRDSDLLAWQSSLVTGSAPGSISKSG